MLMGRPTCTEPFRCARLFLRRLAGAVPVLLVVSVFVFAFVHLLPGDPARLAAGPDATQQTSSWCARRSGSTSRLGSSIVRYRQRSLHGRLRPVEPHQAAGGRGDRRALHADASG